MLDALQNHFALALVATGFVGLCVGSFLNVVIHRLPVMMERDWRAQCAEMAAQESQEADPPAPFNLVVPRSRCPSCGHMIRAWENIPVLSYLVQRGRCTACRSSISIRYPAIELLTAVLCVAVVARYGVSVEAAGGLLLTFALVALTFIDLDTLFLPDSITLPLLWAGLAFNLFTTYTPLPSAVIGAMAGYLSLWSIYWLFKLATGKEGMGFGDFKLMAAIGAWLGWAALPGVVLLSSVVGAIVGVAMIALAGHDRQVPMPFGPYIAAAGWLSFMWGDVINALYLGG